MAIMKRVLAGILLSLGFVQVAGAASPAAVLAPHRAVYDLTLKSTEDRSGVLGASGRMAIEVTGAKCEGWTVNFRMAMQYFLKRGQTRASDNRSSSWESDDGNSLRFSQQHFVNGKQQEDSLLKVDRKLGDGDIEGVMTKPQKGTFAVPRDAVFPVTHQLKLINAAKAGENRDRSIVFDGSDGAKSHLAVTFIGKEASGREQGGKGAEALANVQSWPISISYFSVDPQSGDLPVYQVSFRLYENGIAGDLTLDYGAFALSGKLAQLDMLKVPACD